MAVEEYDPGSLKVLITVRVKSLRKQCAGVVN
jgi:hypothetical protein